jgi:peroxiredoxin Q/BCP
MRVGDLAPEFSLPDQDGTMRSLNELLEGGPVVLFFYPAAMTKGCTKESCHFRDLRAEFAAIGAQRVGISMDSVDKQAAFSTKHGFDYPLLADVDGAVAKQYGVKRKLDLLRTKRSTFVIDPDRRIRGVINAEFSFETHADKALALLSEA